MILMTLQRWGMGVMPYAVVTGELKWGLNGVLVFVYSRSSSRVYLSKLTPNILTLGTVYRLRLIVQRVQLCKGVDTISEKNTSTENGTTMEKEETLTGPGP